MTDCVEPTRQCPFDENTRIQLARMGDQMDHLTDRFEHMETKLSAIDSSLHGDGHERDLRDMLNQPTGAFPCTCTRPLTTITTCTAGCPVGSTPHTRNRASLDGVRQLTRSTMRRLVRSV